MTTRIGLISDVHATPAPLQEALDLFARERVSAIFCAGDIAGYGKELEETVGLLAASGCRSILGNHDLWWLADREADDDSSVVSFLRGLPLVMEHEMEGVRVVMVHGAPPASVMEGIRLLDEDGDIIDDVRDFWLDELSGCAADVLVVGHTHQVFAEQFGNVLVINPGSTLFNHTCAILELPARKVDFLALGGHRPEKVWNWGLQFRRPS